MSTLNYSMTNTNVSAAKSRGGNRTTATPLEVIESDNDASNSEYSQADVK